MNKPGFLRLPTLYATFGWANVFAINDDPGRDAGTPSPHGTHKQTIDAEENVSAEAKEQQRQDHPNKQVQIIDSSKLVAPLLNHASP